MGHVARMGEGRGVYRVLVGRPEGKRPLGIPRHRWEDNIKMDLREKGIVGAKCGRTPTFQRSMLPPSSHGVTSRKTWSFVVVILCRVSKLKLSHLWEAYCF
jgi:hypothetical protein